MQRELKYLIDFIIPKRFKITAPDFVMYSYNSSKVAKLRFEEFLKLFESFVNNSNHKKKKMVSEKARVVLSRQRNLNKIHRTRNDKNWRKFAKLGQ